MVTSWTAPFADGWNAVISPDGRYLACGFGQGHVVEIATKKIVSINRRCLVAGWRSPTELIFMGDPGIYVASAPDFLPTRIYSGGFNWTFAAAGHWIGAVAGKNNIRVVLDGVENFPGYFGCNMGPDGTWATTTLVNSELSTILVFSPTATKPTRSITPKTPPSSVVVGVEGYVGYGYYGPSWLNTPDNTNLDVTITPERQESPAQVFRYRDQLWLLSTNDRGVWLRPLGERSRAIVLPVPSVYARAVVVGDDFLIAAATDKGKLTLFTVPAATQLADLPPVPAEPPVTIGRPMWCGFFNFQPADTPGNCRLNVSDLIVRGPTGQAVAIYCAGAPDETNTAAIEAAIVAAKASGLPVIAYWPHQAHEGRVPIGADIVGVEAYRLKGESLAAFEARIGVVLKRCPKAAIIAQCYTSNATLDPDLSALVPVYARLAKAHPNVWGVLAFSGYGRETGLEDHPEVLPAWTSLAAGIPGPPTEEFMEPWKIAFGAYDKTIARGKSAKARTAIGNGVEIEWEKDEADAIHFAVYKDGKLQDRSGVARHVEVKG